LAWIIDRLENEGGAVETPIGRVPAPGALDTTGLDISAEHMHHLFDLDADAWLQECESTADYFAQFSDQLPTEMADELNSLMARLRAHQ
jgi:phosphoenolpyruvate carboxykinase (GTP)